MSASGFTDYAHDKFLNAIFQGVTPGFPTTWYWAGYITPPTATGGGTESTQTSYARAAVTPSTSTFPNASTSAGVTTIQNGGTAITWPAIGSGATPATWVGYSMNDAITAGNPWVFGQIPSGQQPLVTVSVSPQIATSGFTFSISDQNANGGFSDYLHKLILNGVFQKKAIIPAALYLAAFTANPTSAGGGTESTRTGYARVNIPQNNSCWANAGGSITTSLANLIAATFAQLGGSGSETWTSWGIFDAITGGNFLMWGALATPNQLTIVNGSIPQWPIGALVAELISST